MSKECFKTLQWTIENNTGIFFDQEKAYIVEGRVKALMEETGFNSCDEFIYKILKEKDAVLLNKLIEKITINETFWFRDNIVWSLLNEILLPQYITNIREGKQNSIKILSAACSSGQEPYSIAILIHEYLKKNNINDVTVKDFDIHATDISRNMIDTATKGVYNFMEVERGLSHEYRELYFSKESCGSWVINDSIKEMIRFDVVNLLNMSYTHEDIDLILCRNVLIYFKENVKKEILSGLGKALKRNGIILFGASEIIEQDYINLNKQEFKKFQYYTKPSETE